jgi:hypothetical protein
MLLGLALRADDVLFHFLHLVKHVVYLPAFIAAIIVDRHAFSLWIDW